MTCVQVFDASRCCSAACGSDVDSAQARFAADLEWLQSQGVETQWHDFARQPRLFAETEAVQKALAAAGNKCLPLVVVDGQVVCEGSYPSREELAAFVGVAMTGKDSLYTPGVEELVALGAAVGANCATTFQRHFSEALKAGVSRDDIALAVATARQVKEKAAHEMLRVAGQRLAAERQGELPPAGPCCAGGAACGPKANGAGN